MRATSVVFPPHPREPGAARTKVDAPVARPGDRGEGIAREAVRISHLGLRNRKRVNFLSQDECVYLAPLETVVATGRTVADELLARYHGPWHGNVDHVFEEFAF